MYYTSNVLFIVLHMDVSDMIATRAILLQYVVFLRKLQKLDCRLALHVVSTIPSSHGSHGLY